MIEYHATFKGLHVAAVLTSGGLFFLRGTLLLAGSGIGMTAPVRFTSYAIDTVLLISALVLAATLHLYPVAQPWLSVKVGLLAVYIVLGSFALKRGDTPRVRTVCFVAALLVYGFMISVARTRHPLGLLHAI